MKKKTFRYEGILIPQDSLYALLCRNTLYEWSIHLS